MSLSITPKIMRLPTELRFNALPELAEQSKLVQVLTGSVDAIFHHPTEGLIELQQSKLQQGIIWKSLIFHQQGVQQLEILDGIPVIKAPPSIFVNNFHLQSDAKDRPSLDFWEQALQTLEKKAKAIEPNFYLLA